MTNNDNQRYFPLRDPENPFKVTLTPISEEQYRALYPDIWAKVVGIVAVGYGQTQGVPHKSKKPEEVSTYSGEAPEWFKAGVFAALLAPTALAKQAFTIKGDGNQVHIDCNNGIFTGVDTGLVKYHFELGAGTDNFKWV